MAKKSLGNIGSDDQFRSDFLWKVISRIDQYIGSTNAKSAFIVTFCAILFGVVVSAPEKLLQPFETYKTVYILVGIMIYALVGSLLVSLWFALKVVNPFLSTSSEPGGYHSKVFFVDVAHVKTAEKYFSSVQEMSRGDVEEDLAKQAHSLAIGANSKFKNLQYAIVSLLFVSLPVVMVYVVLRASFAIFGG